MTARVRDDTPRTVTDELDIQALLAEARKGTWRPVNVLVGAESFLIDRAARQLRRASIGESGVPGFNDDVFHGAGLVAARVVAAARTLPMMASVRYVLVRDLQAVSAAELDALADYVQSPSPSTCLVLVGEKLLGTTRLAKAAKALAKTERGAFLTVEPIKGAQLERFIHGEAKRRRVAIDEDAASRLVDAIGNDLAAMEDAIERLSLFVATSEPRRITSRDVEEVVSRVRVDTIWKLVDAIALKQARSALEATGSLLADGEAPLGILAQVARQIRIVARMKGALDEGLRPDDAVRRAGAPPFKARALQDAARKFSDADLRHAFRVLAETDQALKGSKRDREVLLEECVLALTR